MKNLAIQFGLVCLVAMLLWGIGRGQAQDDAGLKLWMLASDETYANAHLMSYDVATGTRIDDVILPHYMRIASAAWSPDFKTLAVITMLGDFPVRTYNGICFFNREGVRLFCRTLNIIDIITGRGDGVVRPAPIYWSEDSRSVQVVVNQTEPYPLIAVLRQVEIVRIDVVAQTVTTFTRWTMTSQLGSGSGHRMGVMP
jgi:hypothetical protein